MTFKKGMVMLCVLAAARLALSDSTLLFDFQHVAVCPELSQSDCSVSKTDDGLVLSFGHAKDWPNVRFFPDQAGFDSDWSGYSFLAVTLQNLSEEPVPVAIRVDSIRAAGKGRQGTAQLMPRETRRLILPFQPGERIIGMRGQPPAFDAEPGDQLLFPSAVDLDTAGITGFQVFLPKPRSKQTLALQRVELIRQTRDTGRAFVDRFGQYNGADWPGKLQREDQFPERIAAEEKQRVDRPDISGRNEYGGWDEGPQLEASGHFRIQKVKEKWWLVDPSGRLFWSSGVTGLNLNLWTVVADRDALFEWLPTSGDPLYRMRSGKHGELYDFYKANLYRKYGEGFEGRYFETALRRFKSWGINTIGNWSSPKAWAMKKVPYTIPVYVPGLPGFVATTHKKAGLEKAKSFPDPFDPSFEIKMNRAVERHASCKDDPWLLGVFIDNELPWCLPYGKYPVRLSSIALTQGPELVMKRVLVDALQKKYSAIAGLNAVWGTTFKSWAALRAPAELSAEQQQAADPDLSELDRLIARQYFQVCKRVLRTHLPDTLYLGCRFSGMFNREVVAEAAQYCDVVSFNIYNDLPTARSVDELALEMDFPVVIGEFHFGALDRGMFDCGLGQAVDQKARAEKYRVYMSAAAQASWCVGAHWFQYVDQPLTGRPDGENYNIGFVDATDDVYPELSDAARNLHKQLYSLRAASVAQ